jgi:hypothetical protein
MSYSFEINHKLKIIHSKHTGNLLLEDIEEAIRALFSYQEFIIKRYNLIVDFRTCIFNFSISELIQAEKRIQTITNIIYTEKIAFIIDNHRNMAVAMMFSNRHLERNTILVKFFTTEESAKKWAI